MKLHRWLLLLLPITTLAASFDCSKRGTPTEQVVCQQPDLSAMDEKLAVSYQRLNQKGILNDDQRAWLQGPRAECKADVACLQSRYQERLAQLENAKLLQQRISNASSNYVFDISLLDWRERDWAAEGPAIIRIIDRHSNRNVQVLQLPNVFMSYADDGTPLVNSARFYDFQGVINMADFDFDGHADFAIQNGNEGSYDGPSYSVYLYNAAKRRFEFNDVLSNLTIETLGMFQVDAKHKRLQTFAKSGCCYHEQTAYQFDARHKLYPVAKKTEEVEVDGKHRRITEEKFINGRWHRTIRHQLMDDENQ